MIYLNLMDSESFQIDLFVGQIELQIYIIHNVQIITKALFNGKPQRVTI
tara:strand:+ start:61080 stop:61226 length:147 start_codon:yes stop_codon:yes gene_type:complete